MATSDATGPSEENEEDSQDKYVPPIPDLKQRGQDKEKRIRIIAVGKAGDGKSATCNTIIAWKKPNEGFKTSLFQTHETKNAQMQSFTLDDGTVVDVVDTPGMLNEGLTIENLKEAIFVALNLIAPGPHVILYVLAVGRYTKNEVCILDDFKRLFKKDPFKFTIIVMTGKDKLDKEKVTEDEYLRKTTEDFKSFEKSCNNRVVFFNNYSKDKRTQWNKLHEKIKSMQLDNQATFYSNELIKSINEGKNSEIANLEKKGMTESEAYFHFIIDILNKGKIYWKLYKREGFGAIAGFALGTLAFIFVGIPATALIASGLATGGGLIAKFTKPKPEESQKKEN